MVGKLDGWRRMPAGQLPKFKLTRYQKHGKLDSVLYALPLAAKENHAAHVP